MKTSLPEEVRTEAKLAARAILSGETILYPTDTIWGLGCDATNASAVDKIFSIKGRDPGKGLIILVAGENDLYRYVKEVPEVAFELLEVAEKPLTLVLPGARNLATGVAAPDGSVAIRIPRDPFCLEILRSIKKPLVSTSANLSGEPAPENYSSIPEEVKSGAGHICNYRQDEKGKGRASSIISLGTGGQVRVIRS